MAATTRAGGRAGGASRGEGSGGAEPLREELLGVAWVAWAAALPPVLARSVAGPNRGPPEAALRA
eukprot:8254361-Alexandrium_andersonii.AAC.1